MISCFIALQKKGKNPSEWLNFHHRLFASFIAALLTKYLVPNDTDLQDDLLEQGNASLLIAPSLEREKHSHWLIELFLFTSSSSVGVLWAAGHTSIERRIRAALHLELLPLVLLLVHRVLDCRWGFLLPLPARMRLHSAIQEPLLHNWNVAAVTLATSTRNSTLFPLDSVAKSD